VVVALGRRQSGRGQRGDNRYTFHDSSSFF
jgi:hypothetical protein